MPMPWIQIVQLMPAILDVSRELLKRSRQPAKPPAPVASVAAPGEPSLEPRVAALEEVERRQAELVSNMAEQLAKLTAAATVLHRQVKRLILGQVAAAVVALVALLIAISAQTP